MLEVCIALISGDLAMVEARHFLSEDCAG